MARRSNATKTRRRAERPGARGATSGRPGDLEARFQTLGLKRSAVRDAVIDAFFASRGHVSVEELTQRARAAVPTVSQATVYRTMRLLVENGIAAERDFGEARARFEPAHTAHHDHLICTSCGTVAEFEQPSIEELQARVARELGYEIESHKLELYGRCARCRRTGGPASGGTRVARAR